MPCCLQFCAGSLSDTSRASFIFMRGVSLTHPVLVYFYAGNFSYTCHAGFSFVQGVCLTHPVLRSFLCGEFLLHIPSCLLFLCGEFLLHIPCWPCLMWGASFLCSLLSKQSLKKRAAWKLGQEKSVKKSLKPEKEALEQLEQSRAKPNKN